MTEGLDRDPDVVDEPGPGTHQGFAGADQGKVRLRRLASRLYGRQEFRVEPGQPRQLLGVDPVGFAALGVDELQFAGVWLPAPRDRILRAKRLIHGEWVPASMAMRIGRSESKRRPKASGVVRSLPSSITSSLLASRRHK